MLRGLRVFAPRPAGRHPMSRFLPRRWVCRRWSLSGLPCWLFLTEHDLCLMQTLAFCRSILPLPNCGELKRLWWRVALEERQSKHWRNGIVERPTDIESRSSAMWARWPMRMQPLRKAPEFLFLDRQTPPDENVQAEQYQAIAAVFAPRPVVIRTLDIGGDKPIPYLPLPREENPALGLRGVRTSLWRMDLLHTQLRAVLKVRPLGQCKLLLPMITGVTEVRAIRAALDDVRKEIGLTSSIEIGVMIETPASAVIADQLIHEADFLSIGTNDLTQYTLAMDRSHPELAAQLDALHPAVLRLIATAAKAGRAQNKVVAVCGGLASDPIAAPILIGLGVTELSAIASVIPRLKTLIASLTLDECRDIANRALEQSSAAAVRELLKECMVKKAGAPA